MTKTKLGVSACLVGAALYFFGLFGGYIVTVLLAGYVLLFEENAWLKKCAVKSVAVLVLFSLLTAVVNLLPNAINVIDEFVRIFDEFFHVEFISNLANFIVTVLNFLEKLLFLGLGLKALKQGDIKVPVVDKLIEKYM